MSNETRKPYMQERVRIECKTEGDAKHIIKNPKNYAGPNESLAPQQLYYYVLDENRISSGDEEGFEYWEVDAKVSHFFDSDIEI